MEQEQGNKLIAEFDGRYTTDSSVWVNTAKRLVHYYEYHTSWDWLVPVVEKIERLGFSVTIEDNNCFVVDKRENQKVGNYLKVISDYESDKKIASVWLAVVEFINWYNQNK